MTHHLLYFFLRHWDGQTPHDVVEIFSGDEVLVQFVLLSAEICREGFCAAKYLQTSDDVVTTMSAFIHL